MGSDGLAVDVETAGDLRNRKPLAVKIQDHDEFPKCDHRAPPAHGRIIGDFAAPPTAPLRKGAVGGAKLGNFQLS